MSPSRFFAAFVVISIIAGCRNSPEPPFPAGEGVFPPPISQPLTFSPEIKIKWQESPLAIRPTIEKFDFNKLPLARFDSVRFKPFLRKPDVLPLDLDQLPKTSFDYLTLHASPLKYTVSKLTPPRMTSGVHPHPKNGAIDLIYEFGEPFLGSTIESVFEDREGFIWIGSNQGFYRYDGENLWQYDLGLGTSRVLSIAQDHAGKFWLAASNGRLLVLDLHSSEFRSIDFHDDAIGYPYLQLAVDRQDRIWMTFWDQGTSKWLPVYIIDEQEQLIRELPLLNSNASKSALFRDDSDRIWVPTFGEGIFIVDPASGMVRRLGKQNGLSSDSIVSIARGDSDRVLIGMQGGALNMFDPIRKTLKRYGRDQRLEERNNIFISGMDMIKGRVGLASYGSQSNGRTGGVGLEIIDPANGETEKIDAAAGLSGDQAVTVLTDKRGQTWIGTIGGLNRLGWTDVDIRRRGNVSIAGLAEDSRGNIWVGTVESGVKIVDLSTGMARSLTTSNGLSNNVVNNIDIFHGSIYLETCRGLDIIDSTLGTIRHYGRNEGLPIDTIAAALLDPAGRIWLMDGGVYGIVTGIYIIDPKQEKLYHLGKEQGLKENFVHYCLQDRDGNLWFAAYNSSIVIIDPKKGTLKYLENIPSLEVRGLKYIQPDKQGNMWIAGGNTVYRVNPTRDSILQLSRREGFEGRQIISLNEYNGDVYVGTQNEGVIIIHPPSSPRQNNWFVESFGKQHGINKLVGTERADIVTKDGSFLRGDKGITLLRPAPADPAGAKTMITAIDLLNNPLFFANGLRHDAATDSFYPGQQHIDWDSVRGPYNMPVNLRLPYDDNYLMFHFTGSNAGSNGKTAYRYFLRGFNKKWSGITPDNKSVNYMDLPPGDYTFEVAGLSNGKWTQPASFSFTILPPWWLTWWAYTIYALMLFAAIWIIAQYRSRWLQKENVRLEAIVKQRTKELSESLENLQTTQSQLIQSEKMASLGELTAGIAHEIQNPLNFVNNFSELNAELIEEMKTELIAGHGEEAIAIANNIRDNEEKINHHGRRADGIVKGMLQHSRTSTGLKEPTDLNALADEYLRLSFHGIRAKEKSFHAEAKTDLDESIGSISLIPQDIGRVLLNLYNNAFYAVSAKKKLLPSGYEPTVLVTTRRRGDRVELEVWDNGNGIPQKVVDKIFQPFFTTKPAGEGTGLGLSLSYDIIKAHGGEIRVETKEGEWTEFTIRLPAG